MNKKLHLTLWNSNFKKMYTVFDYSLEKISGDYSAVGSLRWWVPRTGCPWQCKQIFKAELPTYISRSLKTVLAFNSVIAFLNSNTRRGIVRGVEADSWATIRSTLFRTGDSKILRIRDSLNTSVRLGGESRNRYNACSWRLFQKMGKCS